MLKINMEHKGYDFPSKLKEVKNIKGLKKVVAKQKKDVGLRFKDYLRIGYNGFLTVGQNLLKGKAPFGKLKFNFIFWMLLAIALILIL